MILQSSPRALGTSIDVRSCVVGGRRIFSHGGTEDVLFMTMVLWPIEPRGCRSSMVQTDEISGHDHASHLLSVAWDTFNGFHTSHVACLALLLPSQMLNQMSFYRLSLGTLQNSCLSGVRSIHLKCRKADHWSANRTSHCQAEKFQMEKKIVEKLRATAM